MNLPKNLIACNIEYYTLAKEILVMQDGKDAEHIKCENIDKLSKMLYNISKEKQINEILISGEKDKGNKIAQEIMSYEVHEYNTNNIKITVI